MDGQIDFAGYLESKRKIFPGCDDCICRNCLYWWSSRCPHGKCYDDKRAIDNPYNAVHPDEPPRTAWSDWARPGEQEHWCRGGLFYPVSYCKDFVKYKECKIKECLKCNVAVYQDGYIDCSLIEHHGCEACYEEFERKNN